MKYSENREWARILIVGTVNVENDIYYISDTRPRIKLATYFPMRQWQNNLLFTVQRQNSALERLLNFRLEWALKLISKKYALTILHDVQHLNNIRAVRRIPHHGRSAPTARTRRSMKFQSSSSSAMTMVSPAVRDRDAMDPIAGREFLFQSSFTIINTNWSVI